MHLINRHRFSAKSLSATILLSILLHFTWAGTLKADTGTSNANSDSCAPLVRQALAQIRDAMQVPIDSTRCEDQKGFLEANARSSGRILTLDLANLPIVDKYVFYGLAAYYNTVQPFEVRNGVLSPWAEGQALQLSDSRMVAAAGRYFGQLFDAPGAKFSFGGEQLKIAWGPGVPVVLTVAVTTKNKLSAINPPGTDNRYFGLWPWLGFIAQAVEWSLVTIHSRWVDNWGWSIVIFAIFIKFLLLPVSLITLHFQRQVSANQAKLEPLLAEIKAHYDGEEAHVRIMAAHKSLGITPFHALKPLLGSFIQIPILIAVFNALGEMPQLAGAQFLWIGDLSHPDAIATLPSAIPLLGDKLSLLPFIMTLVTVFSTLIFHNKLVSETENKRQKRNLYLMAAGFFVLFYPFPAAMVLYWTLANILQTIQQQLFKI